MTLSLTHDPINPAAAYDLIAKNQSGSVVLHYAVVKEDAGNDRPTSCIDYRSNGDVEAELGTIAARLREGWNLEDVLLIRRIGCLGVGEIISLVAASAPNSEDAFEACKYGIGRLKKMATIAKTEKLVEAR
jgi:molybdopterin synthase catalytic subunit